LGQKNLGFLGMGNGEWGIGKSFGVFFDCLTFDNPFRIAIAIRPEVTINFEPETRFLEETGFLIS